MIPIVPVLEGVACVAGAWISPVGLGGGHFLEEALIGTFCLLATDSGIPTKERFPQAKVVLLRVSVKTKLFQDGGTWRRRTTNPAELPQAVPASP